MKFEIELMAIDSWGRASVYVVKEVELPLEAGKTMVLQTGSTADPFQTRIDDGDAWSSVSAKVRITARETQEALS